jgi:hypothetical protein
MGQTRNAYKILVRKPQRIYVYGKVKLSRYRPGQALGVPGG